MDYSFLWFMTWKFQIYSELPIGVSFLWCFTYFRLMFRFNASWSGLENRFEKFRKNIYQFLVKLKTYSLRHVYIPAYIPHFQNSYLSGWLLLQQLRNEKGQQSITQLGLIRVLRHFTWVIISSNMRGWKLYLQGHAKNLAYRVWVSLAKPYTKILEKFKGFSLF